MKEPLQTRKCHRCHRHSWHVADGNSCPWCGRKTGKYHYLIDTGIIVMSIIAIAAAIAAGLWL